MKWTFILGGALTILFLGACRGGGSTQSSPAGPATPAPANPSPETVSNSISGTWFYIYPENQCTETFTFSEDGAFEINSGEANISGRYTFDETVNKGERHSLELNFRNQNSGKDCEGEFQNIVGVNLTLFGDFLSAHHLELFEDEAKQTATFSLTLDNPMRLGAIPVSINYNDQLSFNVIGEREFESPLLLELAPSGMEINEFGEVNWKPEMPMFGTDLDVFFRISSAGSLNSVAGSIIVNRSERPFPVARTRSRVVGGGSRGGMKNLLVSGNFDQDPEQDIVFLDGGLTMVGAGIDSLEWKWTYPFDFPADEGSTTVTPSIRKFDTNNDNIDNIYISRGRKIFTLDSLGERARQVYSSAENFGTFEVADLNGDGHPEIVVVKIGAVGEYVEAFDTANQRVLFESEPVKVISGPTDIIRSLRIGNVDNDENLEIVLPIGIVIDGGTGEIQWEPDFEFGNEMILGDLNQDGSLEIIGNNEQGTPQIWNASNQSSVASGEDPIRSNCGISLGKIDASDDANLQYFDCDGNLINSYSLNETSLILESTISLNSHNPRTTHFIDINTDGINEVILNSFGTPHGLSLFNIDEGNIVKTRRYHALHNFNVAGWAEVAPGNYKGVMLVDNDSSFHGKQSIVQVASNGQFEIGEALDEGPFLNSYPQLALVDRESDGYIEVLATTRHPGSSNYFSMFEVVSNTQLENLIIPNTRSVEQSARLELFDLTGDGTEEILMINDDIFFIQDIETGNVLASVPVLRGNATQSGYDFAVKSSEQGLTTIAVSSGAGTRIFGFSEGELVQLGENDKHCTILQFLIISGKLFCYEAVGLGNYLSVFDDNLQELSLSGIDHNYFSFIKVPRSDNLFASVNVNSAENGIKSFIVEVNPFTGEHLWESPGIIGTAEKTNLHVIDSSDSSPAKLFFSTGSAVYLTN